jgi:PAS domain S-box-containing protein
VRLPGTRGESSSTAVSFTNLWKANFRGTAQFIGLFAIVTVTLLSPQVSSAAPVKQVRRVLIFHELGLSSPAEILLDQQIVTVLQNSPFQIELYREYLEANLFPSPSEQQEIRDSILHRYRDRKLDLIIALGMDPLVFVVDMHERAFKDVPVVFGGTLVGRADSVKLDSQYTGIWESFEPEKTLEVALRLQPRTRHVVVVGGKTAFDSELVAWFHERLRSYESSLDITYVTDLPMSQLLDSLSRLDANTVVLMTHIGLDAAGTNFVGASQADPMVVKASNAPVFGPSDVDLGHGEVGGYLDSFALEGSTVGEMATRILGGESPKNIPVVRGANVYMFDWRALRRWGLEESNLPPGSIVLNRQPTVWQAYKWYIVGATSLMLLETLLILALVWQRHRRKKAESELAFTYDGLCLAVEAGRAVGWDWDVEHGCDRWFGDLQTMFGIPSDNYSGNSSEFRRRVHLEDEELVWKAIDVARRDRKTFVAEFRVIRIDGAIRWITAAGKFYYGRDDEAERMLGMAVDITERKRVEETLSDISRKLLQAQEQERSRIARELHDDLNQRLAMLAVELETVQAIRPDLPSEIRIRLQELRKQTMEMSTDVQALSHDLHTSKLEYLGVIAAMKSWCREFSERQSIEINFKDNVSSVVPPEIGLVLFRVLQETVHNAAKHSGVKQVSAQIVERSDGIHLVISDSGRGFDVEAAKKGIGLGLTSMQERVRLVNGTIAIQSRPIRGTSVHVHVPLESGREAQQAAG